MFTCGGVVNGQNWRISDLRPARTARLEPRVDPRPKFLVAFKPPRKKPGVREVRTSERNPTETKPAREGGKPVRSAAHKARQPHQPITIECSLMPIYLSPLTSRSNRKAPPTPDSEGDELSDVQADDKV